MGPEFDSARFKPTWTQRDEIQRKDFEESPIEAVGLTRGACHAYGLMETAGGIHSALEADASA